MSLTHLFEKIDTVQPRHVVIRDDTLIVALGKHLEALSSIFGCFDLECRYLTFEEIRSHVCKPRLIIDM